MKLARIHGPDELRLDEVPEPEPGPDDALLEVAACGICGSDVGYLRIGGLMGPTPDPMPIGHELAGTVIAKGDRVSGIEIGARVALDPLAAGHALGNGGTEGGFTTRLLVRGASQGKSLFPIPDDLSFEAAALAEPLGVGMNAVDRVHVEPGDRVAVLGAGPIGLTAIATLIDRGIEDVVAVDLSETRLEIARKLGARKTIRSETEDPWEGLARAHGTESFFGAPLPRTNVFIEATGSAPLLADVIERSAPKSRISIVGLHRAELPVSFMTVMVKQLTLQGAMAYPDRFEDPIDLLSRHDLTKMITHRFPLDDLQEAFAVARSPEAGAKVMIEIA